jgi:putative DNA primase/helicase
MVLTEALSEEHYTEIVIDSSVEPAVAEARGYRTLTGTPAEREELESFGFTRAQVRDESFPLLLIPMRGMDGEIRGHQIKPAAPRTRVKEDGTRVPVKYETPFKAPLVVDVPVATAAALKTPGTPLWVTEGMKKTDSLVSRGMACVGLQGVFNWRNRQGVLGDWEEIPIKDRPVVLCFDADASSNRNVQLAMSRAGAWFKSRGASKVHYVVVPGRVGDTEVKGVDDWFAAGGTVEGLHEVATQVPPGTGEKDAGFTDAFLVEDLAEALAGRFCWASGLGWLRWTGRVWKEVPDVEPLEVVRQWASEQFDKVLAEQQRDRAANLAPKLAGWRAVLGKTRLTALRDLSKGLLQRDAAEFDGDPDLLTVLNGTLHLPTGRLLEFNPEHCITKSCDAEYRRGFTHPMWTSALRAVPGELHEWYQDRLGQALTGYPTPDHTLVIACGTGGNGKSTVADVVRKTVGGYGVLVSDRVLMANPDAHPTELMDLRGARYAVMEETPEARHLNVQRLKATIGTPVIRARHIRQDTVEFLTSHSLFINTNYRPVVTETDWGTWRRLALMTFPLTFRKPGEPLEGPDDRRGDPALAYISNDPEVRAAALTWMAEGAREWYRRGRMMLQHPERVERETREWRAETDLILGFSDECLRYDRDAFTQTRDMLTAFNEWIGERGHRPWNDRTFATRFGDHDTVRGHKVRQGRFSIQGKQMRGWSGVEIDKGGMDPMTGERDDPPAPELPEWPCSCDPGPEMQHRDYCGQEPDWDASCLADPDGPAGPDRPDPVTLGFDLETAGADQLFTGGHEGPFVRLAGAQEHDETWQSIGTVTPDFLEELARADVIYGHNILGFDLLALAHHHGADYDALAAKAVDTRVLAYLIEPPAAKAANVGYDLDSVAQRLGHEGKTDDLKALAKRYGGFDRIPLDSREYQDYLRGDLAATKAVYEGLRMLRMGDGGSSPSNATIAYAKRETQEVVPLQNRMTLNGWAIDTDLLAERVAEEEAARLGAIQELHEKYGVPLAAPDRFKLLPKAEAAGEGWAGLNQAEARERLAEDPEKCVRFGIAARIPGRVHTKPWVTEEGKAALIKAFHAAGAKHVPLSPKSGTLLTSADALGEGTWYCTERRRAVKGMLHPDAYGSNDAVRAIVDVLLRATGVRDKYNQMTKLLSPAGRIHGMIGAPQGSGRWAMSPFTTMGKRTPAALRERDVVVADPGHVLIACDHSQLDVRTVAALSQDSELIAMLAPDAEDYHEAMSRVYFGTPDRRKEAKPINHGVNYGQGAHAIAERNGLDETMVADALRARGDRFSKLMEWTERVREQAAAGQLLDNGFGRMMRATPERAFTQAPALMGQGASRDVMCESLLRLDKLSEGRVRPYLRAVVHDEIVVSVPEHEADEWAALLCEAMTWEWRGVPILCDVSTPAYRWSDCK